jgi:hypothetical protein
MINPAFVLGLASVAVSPFVEPSVGRTALPWCCVGAHAARVGNGPAMGDVFPAGLSVTAVRDRMPSLRDPDVTYVVTFMDTSSVPARRALPGMSAVAARFGKRVAVVTVHEDPVSAVRAFADDPEWAPKLGFAVTADPNRHALQTVFGPNSFPNLPISFVVRGGKVQWRGAPAELVDVVPEVVEGRWDIATAVRIQEQQALWDAEFARIESMAKAGRSQDALAALETLCQSAMPAQRAQCDGRRFSLMVEAGQVDQALAIGEAFLSSPASARQAAGAAWSICNTVPGNAKAMAFALRAAEGADRALGGKDAMVGAILARVLFLEGQAPRAAEVAKRALAHADTPELERALREDLQVYAPTKR